MSDSGNSDAEFTHNTGSQGSYKLTGPVTQYRGGVLPPPALSSVALKEAHQSAMAYAIAHIDSSEFSFGEDIAEIRETLGFLRNPIKSLTDISRRHSKHAKKVSIKNGVSIAQAMSDTYLTYRFAYTPAVRSMSDAMTALAYRSIERSDPPRLTARGHAKVSLPVENGTLDLPPFGFKTTASGELSVRAQILYTGSGIDKNSKLQQLGLRAKDIPETIWAVMPYSFMVDRIWNVSQFIRGITNLSDPRITILAASVTEKLEQNRSVQFVSQDTASWTMSGEGNVVSDSTFTYTRTVWHPSALDAVGKSDLANLVSDSLKIADLVTLIFSRLR